MGYEKRYLESLTFFLGQNLESLTEMMSSETVIYWDKNHNQSDDMKL